MGEINDYMDPVFEEICRQYLTRLARRGKLPFVPFKLGKWWGTNPAIRAQDDIDILALDKKMEKGIFVECKFRNKAMPMEEYEDLAVAAKAFPQVKQKYLMFISKAGFTEPVKRRAEKEGAVLLAAEDLMDFDKRLWSA